MTDATPKPQFLSATMEGVLVALDDTDPANPIACETGAS
jgi:hypothetical protein